MATKLGTPFVFENLSSAPSSPAAGWAYFDTTLNQYGVYNGSTWVYLPGINSTAATIQPTGTQAAGNSTQAAAANHVHFSSGQFLRSPNVYAPGTLATLATTSATFSAVSSGTVCTGSFTAPASGEVVVGVSLCAKGSATVGAAFALAASGTVSPLVCDLMQPAVTSTVAALSLSFPVTGLTAGNSYNFDLLYAVLSADTLSVLALGSTATTITTGNGAPVVVTTEAV